MREIERLRFRLVIGLALLVAGVFLTANASVLSIVLENLGINPRVALPMGVTLIGAGVGSLLMQYLQGSISLRFLDTVISIANEGAPSVASHVESSATLRKDLDDLREQLGSLRAAQTQALVGTREELLEAIRPLVAGDLADELQKRLYDSLREAAHLKAARIAFEIGRGRLQGAIASLTLRSQLNLVIGALTAAVAVAILGYMVLGVNKEFGTPTALLSHYIPRVTLVVFIEVFAFFFLRLYRATLVEIQHYQSELTALTLREVELETGWAAERDSPRATLATDIGQGALLPRKEADSRAGSAVSPKDLADLLERFSKLVIPARKD